MQPNSLSECVTTGHPHREAWHKMGTRFRERFHLPEDDQVEPGYTTAPHGTCRVQAIRSVSDWSHGVLTEHSIQNACTKKVLPSVFSVSNDVTIRHPADSRGEPLHLYR